MNPGRVRSYDTTDFSKCFTGIGDPYEEPLNAEITLDSNSKTLEQLTEDVIAWLETKHVLEVS